MLGFHYQMLPHQFDGIDANDQLVGVHSGTLAPCNRFYMVSYIPDHIIYFQRRPEQLALSPQDVASRDGLLYHKNHTFLLKQYL